MSTVNDKDRPVNYIEENNDSTNKDLIAFGKFTQDKIQYYKENEAQVLKTLNLKVKENTVKKGKQELLQQIDEKNKGQTYIQKAFAGTFALNPTSQQQQQQQQQNPNNNSYTQYLQAFDPDNISMELINKIKKKSVINPYSETTYDRMEEAFRTDGALKRGILKKWDFILGANMKIILTLTNEYETRDEFRKMMKVIGKFIPYKTALNEARYILKTINFKPALYDGGVQSSIYNRAAIEKIRAYDNTLIGLNILETRYLGNPIYIPMNSILNQPIDKEKQNNQVNSFPINYADHTRTIKSRHIFWKLFGIEYNDPESIVNSNDPKNIEIIKMKDLIYITRDDVSVSPGTKGFGLSEIEPSLDGSETKRIMKSYDFKEISRSSYSSFGVIKALNTNITKAELQYLVDAMEVNGWVATAHQIQVDTYSLTSDARIMIEILDAMNRETGRDIDVPSPLLGYEHVQNYASLQQTLQSWKESVLDADRRRIKECIETQLLEEILDTSLKRQGYCIKLNEQFELQLYQLDPLTGGIKEEIVLDPMTTMPDMTNPDNLNNNPNTKEGTKEKPEQKDRPEGKKPLPTTNKQKFVFDNRKMYMNSETGETALGYDLNLQNGNVNEPSNADDDNQNASKPMTSLPRFIKRPVKPTIFYEDELTHEVELVEIPPIKISFEISDPNFSIFKDKGEVGLKMYEVQAIGVEKLLELMDMPDEIDDAIKRLSEKQIMDQKQAETNLLMMQNQMGALNRETDAKVMKMRKETEVLGGADKFLNDDQDSEIKKRKSGEVDENNNDEAMKQQTNKPPFAK